MPGRNNWGYPQIRAQNPTLHHISDHYHNTSPIDTISAILVVYPLTTRLIGSTLPPMTTRPAAKKLYTGKDDFFDPWGTLYRCDPRIIKGLDYLFSRSSVELDNLNYKTYAILYPPRVRARS